MRDDGLFSLYLAYSSFGLTIGMTSPFATAQNDHLMLVVRLLKFLAYERSTALTTYKAMQLRHPATAHTHHYASNSSIRPIQPTRKQSRAGMQCTQSCCDRCTNSVVSAFLQGDSKAVVEPSLDTYGLSCDAHGHHTLIIQTMHAFAQV
jgi:hypothetical protein